MLRPALLSSVLLTAPLAAQAASAVFYGSSCPAAPLTSNLNLALQGLPRLGSTFTVTWGGGVLGFNGFLSELSYQASTSIRVCLGSLMGRAN